ANVVPAHVLRVEPIVVVAADLSFKPVEIGMMRRLDRRDDRIVELIENAGLEGDVRPDLNLLGPSSNAADNSEVHIANRTILHDHHVSGMWIGVIDAVDEDLS